MSDKTAESSGGVRDTNDLGIQQKPGEKAVKLLPPNTHLSKRRRSNLVSTKSARYSPITIRKQNLAEQQHHETKRKFISKRTRLVTLIQIGEDWLYLASLGIIMALISFSMDTVITMFLSTKVWLSRDLNQNNQLLQYLGWSIMPVVLVTFSSGFVHLCSPTVSEHSSRARPESAVRRKF